MAVAFNFNKIEDYKLYMNRDPFFFNEDNYCGSERLNGLLGNLRIGNIQIECFIFMVGSDDPRYPLSEVQYNQLNQGVVIVYWGIDYWASRKRGKLFCSFFNLS